MSVLIKIIQLVLSLAILVIIHEFGHFIASRIFGVRVEKFYMFFDWKFSIFRCKKVNGAWKFKFFCKNEPEKYVKVGDKYEPVDLNSLPEDDWRKAEDSTEYGLGWVPLGGYCKIAGMVDESMDEGQLAQDPQPWEFRTKPAWQRLIIMVGGVCMNVILAFLIYIGLIASYGEQYISTEEVNKYGITVDSLGYNLGLRDGDKILTVDGKYIEDFDQIQMELLLENTSNIEVERNGHKEVVELPEDAVKQIIQHRSTFINARMPFVIGGFSNGSYAEKAGMQKSDRIIGINDVETPYFQDFKGAITDFRDQDVDMMVVRDEDTIVINVHVAGDATIGVFPANVFNFTTKEYSFWQSIPRGLKKTGKELSDYWKQLKLIFNPKTKAYESLGGFITIGSIFPESFIWEQFWRMTAFLSIILAVMNILPIPGLDGGHVLFLLWEVITRKKPSDKFLERATMIGFIFLMMLLIYANGNDIIRLFR